MSKRRNTLSFEVESIREFQIDGVTLFDTTLRFYVGRRFTENGVTDERLTIRGKPWAVGMKVDFEQIKEQGS